MPKGITQQAAFAAALSIIIFSPSLAALNGNVSLAYFVPEGFVGIGVPIGTCPLPRYRRLWRIAADLSDAFDETNSFGVTLLVPSLQYGLLHDVFQDVSVHHPH